MSEIITLNSGEQTSRRMYVFLADWNLEDKSQTMRELFNKHMVLELTKDEFRTLFHLAFQSDYETI